ncbi:hypothetical protein H206_00651 [Candidatus Electrothrix aarhusensis]|uniref:Uncharacterized protein n=1 Tax=Candidatus Electrothrix aarhusensis TaxID=1859131 RepID=A0A3S3U814_9BACT|nr:hypothetical protein H206_00651 [Candidatus Electrothrix aarhusensis]
MRRVQLRIDKAILHALKGREIKMIQQIFRQVVPEISDCHLRSSQSLPDHAVMRVIHCTHTENITVFAELCNLPVQGAL